MRPTKFSASSLQTLLHEQKVATMPELMAALGTRSRRTVFRKLAQLEYQSSYSHRGRFYTLKELAEFDERGLWSVGQICFSVHGTLVATAEAFVEDSQAGYFADELDDLLRVGTKDALRKLAREGRLVRELVDGRFLYCATEPARRREQLLRRRSLLGELGITEPLPPPAILPDELRAAIVLFYSLLDEKQRRLYAGLESLKTGRGGDVRMAQLLGMDRGTVARGRQELLGQNVETQRVRRAGGGRPSVEKKRPKSSHGSPS
jgi:hypothetical protein